MDGVEPIGLTATTVPSTVGTVIVDSVEMKKAEHLCPVCGERFVLARDRRVEFPDDWHLWVCHNHEAGEVPSWEAVLFYRAPRQRYSEEAKRIRGIQDAQRRKARETTITKRRESKSPSICGRCMAANIDETMDECPNCGRVLKGVEHA